MKKRKFLFSFLAAFIMLCLFAVTPQAASISYYQTNKANVPIWSQASSSSTKRRTIASANTVLKITGSTKNSSGNLWYQISDGTWVYSGNVSKHSHSYSGGICTNSTCRYEYPYSVSSYYKTVEVTNTSGAKIWSRPYSSNSTHYRTEAYAKILNVVAKTTNQENHVWYKLSDGSWVYSNNVKAHSHSYKGGICSNGYCRYEHPYSVSSYSAKMEVSNKSGAKIWSRPYSSNSTHKRTVAFGSVLNIVSKTTNQENHVWYKLSDGSWVFSENVKKHTHSYKGGMCTNTTCKYEKPYSITAYSATRYVINKSGAKIWSRPYSDNSTHKRTEAYGKALSITAKTTNLDGNLWYKLSDGSWVFSENTGVRYSVKFDAKGGSGAPGTQYVLQGATSLKLSATKPVRKGYTFCGWSTSSSALSASYMPGKTYSIKKSITLYAVWKTCKHSYSGGICSSCKYEYPLKQTAYSGTFVVTNDNGAPAWSRPYSVNSKKVKIYDKNTALTIVAKVTNVDSKGKADNVWYKLSDGNWVFSGNVTKRYTVKYDANGGKTPPSKQYFLSGKSVTISKTKPSRSGYIFKGWATSSGSSWVSYEGGDKYSKNKDLTLYAVWKKCSHKYNSSGVCDTCKYKFKITVDTKFTGSYVITSKDGAVIRNTPYNTSGSAVKTAKQNTLLTVVGKAANAHKNVWYKLSDGNWIFSENVSAGYKVTYHANGGKGAPAATGYPAGKLRISSTKPTRSGYVFMGWATTKTATTASCHAGDLCNVKKNLTLFAVWKKCTHNYKNNYGVCKNCKSQFPLDIQPIDNNVYTVNNKNGVTTYKRPYSKSSEKIKKHSNKTPVLVIGSAKNANNEVWCKLKDGSWIKQSEIKKRTTYNSMDSLTKTFFTAQKGIVSIRRKTIMGVPYLYFASSSKPIYIRLSALTGSVKNTQLTNINKELTTTLNRSANSSVSKEFVYCKKTVKTSSSGASYRCTCGPTKSHQHVRWEMYLLKLEAGVSGNDTINTRCDVVSVYSIDYCTSVKNIDATNTNKLHKSMNIRPTFTVAVTPMAKNGEEIGYFTDFHYTGKGYEKASLKLEDYVDLITGTIDLIDTAGKVVIGTPATKALNIYKLVKSAWNFTSKNKLDTTSTEYKSPEHMWLNNLRDKDDTSKVYRVYKMNVKAPIKLRFVGDYLNLDVKASGFENKYQNITVQLAIK